MYQQHFGLMRPLFADATPQDEAVFRPDWVETLQNNLAIALARADSVAVISGPSGTGKTTIALDSVREISTRLALACIGPASLSADDMLEQLLTDFGEDPTGKTHVERLQLWKQFLAEMAATDTRVCLLIENAERLDPDALFMLHSLTAADANLTPGANVILTLTEPAEGWRGSTEVAAFDHRIRLRHTFNALSERETHDYLEFKCRLGHKDVDDIFEADAASVLFELTRGVLRRLDSLLESALIKAASCAERRVTTSLIRSVAATHLGIPRLDADGVAAILAATDAEAAEFEAEIPTLTEVVVPLPRRAAG